MSFTCPIYSKQLATHFISSDQLSGWLWSHPTTTGGSRRREEDRFHHSLTWSSSIFLKAALLVPPTTSLSSTLYQMETTGPCVWKQTFLLTYSATHQTVSAHWSPVRSFTSWTLSCQPVADDNSQTTRLVIILIWGTTLHDARATEQLCVSRCFYV